MTVAAPKPTVNTSAEPPWKGFSGSLWQREVNVRAFIQLNYTHDLVMLGIKTWNPERHGALTGKDVGPTIEFARRLAARRRPIWIRFVLVPGLTDDMEDLAKTAEFAAGLGNVELVEVLPFHQMGRYKWDRLGLDYTLSDVEAPTAEAAERACEVFRKAGLKAF